MRAPPQQRRLADGRLHLHDGPIDLIIEAFGETSAAEEAYAVAWRRFATILDELCAELPLLRRRPHALRFALTGRATAPLVKMLFGRWACSATTSSSGRTSSTWPPSAA